MTLFEIASALGGFQLVDHPNLTPDTSKDPYEWEPPHWVPNPVPADYDIITPPWLRPEQVRFAIVGECDSGQVDMVLTLCTQA